MFSFFYNNLNTVTKIKYFYKCKLKALESRVWTELVFMHTPNWKRSSLRIRVYGKMGRREVAGGISRSNYLYAKSLLEFWYHLDNHYCGVSTKKFIATLNRMAMNDLRVTLYFIFSYFAFL